jgi:glycosyltransferase involved in cell wall biosynthesis
VADVAALYRRADVFVLPYRAEGFACPVLEAMACGAVPLVPAFGPCLDYCDESTALFVPTRPIALPVGRTLGTNSIGFEEQVDAIEFCETSPDRLAEVMRAAVARPREDLKALGAAAAARARAWTWQASVDLLVAGVHALAIGTS